MPLYALHFVSGEDQVRAVAQLVSRPGAPIPQVLVKAERPLRQGVRYRLQVEATASCVDKPRGGILQKSGKDFEWVVTPPATSPSVSLRTATMDAAQGSSPYRAVEFDISGLDAGSTLVELRATAKADAGSWSTLAVADGPNLIWAEDICSRAFLMETEGDVCVEVRAISRAGEYGKASSPICFSLDRKKQPATKP